jgi:hypothetical protein
MWAGIAGDCLVVPHVLPHRLTGNHYREFLLYDLPKPLEDILLTVRSRMLYMYDDTAAHFSWLCEMFSIIPIMDDGTVQEDLPHGLHACQILIL